MSNRPHQLQCEYLDDPIGIGTACPRLSWRLAGEGPGATQHAWQVLAASEPASLEAGRGDLWDSGRIESDENAQVEYAGAPLGSRQRVWWKVRTFDPAESPSSWSQPARFEIGLLERSDWRAGWIASPLRGAPAMSAGVPALRREFEVVRPVERARLYVTALGLYELSIGGRRVGDHQLAPGWTDYRKRVRYQVFDVTDHLAPGSNSLDALLGDGWYCGFVGLRNAREAYGNRPALLAQLEIEHDDGSTTQLCTDTDWCWQASPILAADLMMGETVDARRTLEDGAWQPVDTLEWPDIALDAMSGPPVRIARELAPVSEPRRLHGSAFGAPFGSRYVFDLGQNMVGRVRLRVRAEGGTSVRLRHAEALNPDASLYTENLKGAAATDCFTLAGTGATETFEPHFTFHGFRYVEVSGDFPREAIEELAGVVLCSDMPETGEFSCSNDHVNQLQRNITWGQRGNFLDVPTDCPQRDERLGWTGDAQVFIGTAAFNMGVAGFFSKWLQDLEDAQAESGRVPPVAPLPGETLMGRMDGGPAWADAMVICPWTIWRCYGDRRIVEERWDAMVSFMDDAQRRAVDLIRADPDHDPWGGFGDWCALDGTVATESRLGGTPKDLIGTAFLAYCARLMAQMADGIGRPHEAKRFGELFTATRAAFRRRFVTPDGRVVGNTQTSDVLPLHFDLLEPSERKTSARNLARNVELHGHLTTGFVGTPYLLHALADTGRLDLAYKLLLRREYPSWLYPLVHGDATTIWERWNGWTAKDGFFDPEMNSFNHYAYGAVGDFLYGSVAGLRLDDSSEANGWRRARIAPRPPLHPGLPESPLLTRARAALDTQHGPWSSEWHIDDDRFHLEVRVPAGCSARIALPDGSRSDVGPGTHREERALADLNRCGG